MLNMETIEVHNASIPKAKIEHPALNVEAMMQEGLKEIEKLAGNQWTNYNASDPGVTMLEFLSYGLQNLGYKASMPMGDLLTGPDGKIDAKGLFFLPQEVMFTNPVTIYDFRRLLLDRVTNLKNVWIEADAKHKGLYRVIYELRGDAHYVLQAQELYREILKLTILLIDKFKNFAVDEGSGAKQEENESVHKVSDTLEFSKLLKAYEYELSNLNHLLKRLLNTETGKGPWQTVEVSRLKNIKLELSLLLETLEKEQEPKVWKDSIHKLLNSLKKESEEVLIESGLYREIPVAIDAYLMRHRNLGELFCPSTISLRLTVMLDDILGEIYLEKDADTEEVMARVVFRLNDYFSPFIKRCTYAELRSAGYTAAEVLNGPEMANGYITDAELNRKRGSWKIERLLEVIASVEGVRLTAAGKKESPLDWIYKPFDQVFYLNPYQKSPFENIRIYLGDQKSEPLNYPRFRNHYRLLEQQGINPNGLPATELLPPLPKGEFRDIKSYHSIQPLFPGIYGLNSSTDLSVSRGEQTSAIKQLKAYLMLFEQVMADHQAQLANLKGLLGYGQQSKDNLDTYAKQGLYNCPGAYAILKAYDGFIKENNETQSNPGLNWNDFRNSKHNSYASSLKSIQATEFDQIARKESFLSYLLATVGEQFDTNAVINLNAQYGDYRLARIEFIGEILKNFPLTSANIGRGYFYNQHEAKGLLAGLEIKLGLVFHLNSYYKGLLDLIHKFLAEGDTTVFQWYAEQGDWFFRYQQQSLLKIAQNTKLRAGRKPKEDKQEKYKLLSDFEEVLCRLMGRTEGFVLIDGTMLNKTVFDTDKDISPSTKNHFTERVTVIFPKEVLRVMQSDFGRLFYSRLRQEGPLGSLFELRSLKFNQLDTLLKERKFWLAGIAVLQQLKSKGANKTGSKREIKDSERKTLKRAANAVPKILKLLEASSLMRSEDE